MKFKVIKSTHSKNEGFVNTIEGETMETVFGVAKTSKHRFLIKTDVAVAIGTESELNLGQYVQTPRESELVDQQTGEIVKIVSVWLHRKAA